MIGEIKELIAECDLIMNADDGYDGLGVYDIAETMRGWLQELLKQAELYPSWKIPEGKIPLKTARFFCNMSQRDLVDQSGVPIVYIQGSERGNLMINESGKTSVEKALGFESRIDWEHPRQ
ncbi:MAG: hypothetical protein GY718_10150 [Lentisphaerae bacterium]|nr:hypothetical protein [Lentisphaerota bacterium]